MQQLRLLSAASYFTNPSIADRKSGAIKTLALLALVCASNYCQSQAIDNWQTQAIARMTPDSQETHQTFSGLEKTQKDWRLCVVLPNVSDKFWDDIVSGVREESAWLGITSIIYEASGYGEAGLQQQERILNQRCSAGKLDAVLLAAADRSGLTTSLRSLREKQVLVIDFVNGYDIQEVDARAYLDNYHLGFSAGQEIKKYLSAQSLTRKTKILWIPGPKGPDWVKRGDEGFKTALTAGEADITTLHLNPHYREQARDLRKYLSTGKTFDLIVGTGPTSVAAYQLKTEGLIPQATPVFAYYATPDVEKLLADGQLLGAVSNQPRMIGRMGVSLAIGMLEKLPMPFQVGPEPVVLQPKLSETQTTRHNQTGEN